MQDAFRSHHSTIPYTVSDLVSGGDTQFVDTTTASSGVANPKGAPSAIHLFVQVHISYLASWGDEIATSLDGGNVRPLVSCRTSEEMQYQSDAGGRHSNTCRHGRNDRRRHSSRHSVYRPTTDAKEL